MAEDAIHGQLKVCEFFNSHKSNIRTVPVKEALRLMKCPTSKAEI